MIDRTPKPCNHPKARHQHGTFTAWKKDACRCYPCSNAASVHEIKRMRAKAYGQPSRVDPARAAAHAADLCAAGWSEVYIARTAGVGLDTVSKLLSDARRQKRITREVEERILALRPCQDVLKSGYMPVVGASRRLQALAAIGWDQDTLGARLGFASETVYRIRRAGNPKILVTTYQKIAALYDELWDQRGPATRTARYAAKSGWAPPMAWDDESLDDPAAEPDYGQPEPTRAELDAIMRALYDQGMNDAQIGEAVGRSRDAVRHWRNRRAGGLPAIEGTAVALGDERDDRLALWQQGLTDREIADRIGRHPDVVRRWRNRHGLESRTNRKRKEAA